MKIISWNVNGLRAVSGKGFLTWLDGCGADVVFLQETKALPEQLDPSVRHPEGWHSFFHSAERKGYSGVAAYARRAPDQVFLGCGVERFSVEGRSLGLRYGDFVAWGNYFPNGGNDLSRVPYKMDYYRSFLDLMERQRRDGLKLVVGGDYNTAHREIDLARPKDNVRNTGFLPEERAEVQRWLDQGWVDSYRHVHGDVRDRYTWWTQRLDARSRNIGWRIDYWLADEALAPRIRAADNLTHVMGSDHCPVSIELDL